MLIALLHRHGIRLPRWVGVAVLAIAAIALLAGLAAAQPARAHAFVILVGRDTMGIERVNTSAASVSGDIVLRGQPRIQWSAALGRDGLPISITLAALQSASPDAPVLQRAVLTKTGTAVAAEMRAGGATTPRTQQLTTRADAIMLVNQSLAMTELILARALATPAALDSVHVFLASGGQTIPAVVTMTGDSGTVSMGPMTSRVRVAEGRLVEIAVPAQNLRVVRVEGSALATLRLGATDYNAPAGAPWRAEHVKVPAAGGHVLAATLSLPAGSGRHPVAVTISGSGGQERDSYLPMVAGYRPFRELADSLGRRGIAVLRFDDRGIGESTGDHAAATSADFANDVRTLVAWLRQRPDIDPERVFLIGHSEGGMIAPMVAADDARLAGVVLLAGTGERGEDILRFQLRNMVVKDSALTGARRDSALASIDVTVAALRKENAWMRYFFDHDPLATARRVKSPALIVQGATDLQVTPNQASLLEKALREGGNRDVAVLLLPDRNHLFLHDPDGTPTNYVKLGSSTMGATVTTPIAEWILKHGPLTGRR